MPKPTPLETDRAKTTRERMRWIPIGLAAVALLACTFAALFGPRRVAIDPRPRSATAAAQQPAGPDIATQARGRAARAEHSRTRSALGPEGDTQAALAELGDRFHAALDADPYYQRHLACVAAGTDAKACRADLDSALYAAIANALDPFVSEEAQRLLLDWPNDSERIARALRERLAATGERTTAPAETLIAISLLQLVRPDDAFPLPLGAYRDLAERTQPEAQLILNGHRGTPLPNVELKDSALALALDETQAGRMRLAAVEALGHAQDHAQLSRLVEAVRGGGASATLFGVGALSGALARCGAPCNDLVDELAAQPAAEARRIAYRSLSFLPEGQAQARGHQLETLSPESLELTQLQIRAAETPFGKVGD